VKSLVMGLLLCVAGAVAWGLEIPVRRGGPAGSSVGYVDMELVFREYPEARKAREEYQKEVVRHKAELAERERALGDLKREIEALKDTSLTSFSVQGSSTPAESLTSVPRFPSLPTLDVSTETPSGVSDEFPLNVEQNFPRETETPQVSSGTAASVAEGISLREEQLLKRQKELEDARASSAQSLRAFEASRAKTILGRLYKALVELANERGISLVVDKSAILYGQNTIDLTESLTRRVRGLPEAEK
jgi:Skp family chaperone for outer membrane proteins